MQKNAPRMNRTPPRSRKMDLDEVQNLDEIKSGEECGGCGGKVMDGQSGVECEICREWFHTQCGGISPNEYMKITESIIKGSVEGGKRMWRRIGGSIDSRRS